MVSKKLSGRKTNSVDGEDTSLQSSLIYQIYFAIRWGFLLSRMTTDN